MNKNIILFLGSHESPVLKWLRERGEYVMQTEDGPINTDFIKQFGVHMIISHGYRYILKEDILDAVNRNAINLHISVLPWNRGADPNLWSYVDNTPKGVTIHYMDDGLDTGDIINQKRLNMYPTSNHTLASSYKTLQEEVFEVFKFTWERRDKWHKYRRPQPPGGSYHKSIDKEMLGSLLKDGWQTPVKVIDDYRRNKKNHR